MDRWIASNKSLNESVRRPVSALLRVVRNAAANNCRGVVKRIAAECAYVLMSTNVVPSASG